ncbi:hypothetical protein ONE63_006408 [Megalurothrips usitatus]|uniref:Uncharacterized protein n=1 Tax=Megalurothrips usitatus TaxID=439358 RepID=A0AAV7XWN9_9NEOP|nr:hypothetical protein ONE63_006408 [Megalurothrips usitatus]
MALRMKRRERRENKKDKSVNTCRENPTALRLAHQQAEHSVPNEKAADGVCSVQEIDDCSLKWRPTHGNLRFNHSYDGEETEADADGSSGSGCGSGSALSLSEAYSNMHKLDALLRDSDRRLKEAQAETLRAQLSTRAQLRQLRDQVGGHNTMLARNWDAFMQLCPASAEPGPAGPGGHHGKGQQGVGAAGDQGCSVLPRISGADSDADSDDSQGSGSALAITDEEKLKLAALLRDVDQDAQDRDAALAGLSGYLLDPEARRSLEHIDGKLQVRTQSARGCRELTPDVPDTRVPGLAQGATRQQRLEDIDRCLQALAASALGVRRGAGGGGGRARRGVYRACSVPRTWSPSTRKRSARCCGAPGVPESRRGPSRSRSRAETGAITGTTMTPSSWTPASSAACWRRPGESCPASATATARKPTTTPRATETATVCRLRAGPSRHRAAPAPAYDAHKRLAAVYCNMFLKRKSCIFS